MVEVGVPYRTIHLHHLGKFAQARSFMHVPQHLYGQVHESLLLDTCVSYGHRSGHHGPNNCSSVSASELPLGQVNPWGAVF